MLATGQEVAGAGVGPARGLAVSGVKYGGSDGLSVELEL